MNEKRRSSRHKSFFRAYAYLANSPSAIDCLVRDMSDEGARLRFPASVAVTETLELHIPIKGQTVKGKVVWRSKDEVGIEFFTSAAIDSASDDDVASRIRRLEAEVHALKQILKRLQRRTISNEDAA